MALITQTYDDGSTDTYDDATGQIVAATDSAGNAVAVPANGSGIAQQAWGLLTQGISQAINAHFRVVNANNAAQIAASQAAAARAQSQATLQSFLPLALLAGGGLLAYKLIAKG